MCYYAQRRHVQKRSSKTIQSFYDYVCCFVGLSTYDQNWYVLLFCLAHSTTEIEMYAVADLLQNCERPDISKASQNCLWYFVIWNMIFCAFLLYFLNFHTFLNMLTLLSFLLQDDWVISFVLITVGCSHVPLVLMTNRATSAEYCLRRPIVLPGQNFSDTHTVDEKTEPFS